MTRTFIQTKEFSKNWENLGYSDEDLRKLELEIMRNPKAGEVIPETGRLRKLRFSVTAKGTILVTTALWSPAGWSRLAGRCT